MSHIEEDKDLRDKAYAIGFRNIKFKDLLVSDKIYYDCKFYSVVSIRGFQSSENGENKIETQAFNDATQDGASFFNYPNESICAFNDENLRHCLMHCDIVQTKCGLLEREDIIVKHEGQFIVEVQKLLVGKKYNDVYLHVKGTQFASESFKDKEIKMQCSFNDPIIVFRPRFKADFDNGIDDPRYRMVEI